MLNRPPGGGGVWTALMMACAARSSAASPDERVTDWLMTRPRRSDREGDTNRADNAGRPCAGGIEFVAVEFRRQQGCIGSVRQGARNCDAARRSLAALPAAPFALSPCGGSRRPQQSLFDCFSCAGSPSAPFSRFLSDRLGLPTGPGCDEGHRLRRHDFRRRRGSLHSACSAGGGGAGHLPLVGLISSRCSWVSSAVAERRQ